MVGNGNCPVCTTKCEIRVSEEDFARDIRRFLCPTCGVYRCTHEFLIDIAHRSDRHIVSGAIRFICETARNIPLLTSDIDAFLDNVRIPSNVSEQLDLLVEYIGNRSERIGQNVPLIADNDYSVVFGRDREDMLGCINYAKEAEWIEELSPPNYKLMLKGLRKFEELRTAKPKSDQAFVAMSFSGKFKDKLRDVYTNGIKPALEEIGFKPIRIDLEQFNVKICNQIIAEMRRSGLVIADFTGQKQNVYFEAGFALGLGVPVIFTCKSGEEKTLHFDTRQYKHIIWKSPDDLKEQLIYRIRATIPLPE